MKIFDLLRIPIIKWTGIALILYFGLFANTQNPNSLGNRLSKENVQKNFKEARERGKFIVVNVKMAQEIAKEKEAQEKLAKERGGMISINDLDSGTGEKIIGCNDEVEFSYVIQTKDGKEVNSIKKPQKTIIGSKQEKTIERNIIGMKEGGIRSINVPFGSQTDDKKLDTLLKLNGQDLQYLVTVSKIKKSKNPPSSCF
jgi:hypothetical protein